MIWIAYAMTGAWFAFLSWDKRASDTQNLAAVSIAFLFWPLVVVAGLVVAVVRYGK